MIDLIADYDWLEVFALTAEMSVIAVPPGATTGTGLFARDDVKSIEWIDDDLDVVDWLVGGVLRDGRWFFIDSANAYVATSRSAIERFAMGAEERRRLGVELNGDRNV